MSINIVYAHFDISNNKLFLDYNQNNRELLFRVYHDLNSDPSYEIALSGLYQDSSVIFNGIDIIAQDSKTYNDYFTRSNHQMQLLRPLEIINQATSYDVKCSVKGGGLSGQAGAIILGISRALISHEANLKKDLKKDKLTTRDSRVVERKKYGHRKARRSFQFSKR